MVDEIAGAKKSLKNLKIMLYVLLGCYLVDNGANIFLPKYEGFSFGEPFVLLLLFLVALNIHLVCEEIITAIEKNKDI